MKTKCLNNKHCFFVTIRGSSFQLKHQAIYVTPCKSVQMFPKEAENFSKVGKYP